jgi:ribonuclease HI
MIRPAPSPRPVAPNRTVAIAPVPAGVTRRRKPDVTIFADASHDHRARIAGWGAWIKADGQPSITCGAAMKGRIGTTSEAELCALANALTVARLRAVLAPGHVVMLQSDCVDALAIIRNRIAAVEDRPVTGGVTVVPGKKKRKLSNIHSAAIAVIEGIVVSLDITLITRHVRGHRRGDGRQWVNGEVDRIARKAMRERRDALQPEPASRPTAAERTAAVQGQPPRSGKRRRRRATPGAPGSPLPASRFAQPFDQVSSGTSSVVSAAPAGVTP